MRILASILALVTASLAAIPSARAEEASAAGWLGVGAFGPRLATTVDLGVDVEGESYAVGVGARLRYLAGEGVRREDWDDPSEVMRVLRYAIYRRTFSARDDGEAVQVAAAAGALGGVVLGHGSVVDGYATGVDVDHGRVGAQARVDGGPFAFEALVDDLAAPRVVATRTQWVPGDRVRFGFAGVGDLSAPDRASALSGQAVGAQFLPIFVADGEYRRASLGGDISGRAYADLVGVLGVAAGAHLGGAGTTRLGDTGAQLTARAELRLGSDGYLAGWIGPLYDVTREQRLATAAAGGLGGFGGLGEMGVEVPRVGGGSVSFARRPGTADLAALRVAVPHFRGVQGAVWAAVEVGGGELSRQAMALEVRVRLPARMFLLAEAAHLYRSEEGVHAPLWIATAAVGGVVGE